MFGVVRSVLNRDQSCPSLQRWVRPVPVGLFPRPSLPTRGRRERRPRVVRSERATRMANHSEAAIRRPDGRREGTRSLPTTIFRSVEGTLGGSSY